MKLTEVSGRYGAPMGRSALHARGTGGLSFEVEWCPLDDGYDAGGAYWGTPDNLWCAEAHRDGEVWVRYFLRAHDRLDAMNQVASEYPGSEFQSENGSLIEQMISHLQAYCNRCREREPDEDLADTERQIEDLEQMLEEVKQGGRK